MDNHSENTDKELYVQNKGDVERTNSFDNMTEEEMNSFIEEMEREHAPYEVVNSWPLKDIILNYKKIEFSSCYYPVTDGGEPAIFLHNKDNGNLTIINLSNYTRSEIMQHITEFTVSLMESGDYLLFRRPKEICPGYTLFKENDLWGCKNSNGRIIIPAKYDFIFLDKDNDDIFLCGRDGKSYTGYKRKGFFKDDFELTSVYTGVYDLYSRDGGLLVGGFIDYKYIKECNVYLLRFGRNYIWCEGTGTPSSPYKFKAPYGKWMFLDSKYRINGHNGSIVGTIFNLRNGYWQGKSYYENNEMILDNTLFKKIEMVNPKTFLCEKEYSCMIIYLRENPVKEIISSVEYKWIDVLDETYAISYDNGKIGLLRKGMEAIPCEYSYITKPVDGWCFAIKRYPFIPDKTTWHKFFVIFYNVEKNRYLNCYKNAIVAINNIDEKALEDALYNGGFMLYAKDNQHDLSSYTILKKFTHLFRTDFLQQLNSTYSIEKFEPTGNYWESSDWIRYKLEKKNKMPEFHDSYTLMDALDGDPSAYWNID